MQLGKNPRLFTLSACRRRQIYFCKQCRSRWDGSLWAVSSGSTLFGNMFLVYDCHPFGNIGCVQIQRWNSLFQILRVERVVQSIHEDVWISFWIVFDPFRPGWDWGVLKCISTSQKLPASVAQLDAPSDWRLGGRGFNPRRGRQHSFVEIDHEIFSTVILSLPLIQEGQLSVSGERMCTILVNRLED